MAKVKWNDLAASQLENHLDYALEEFGQNVPWFKFPGSRDFINY